jgi:DNA replication protein DnaC
MGVPARYHDAEASIVKGAIERDGVFLHGPVGSGKTYEAVGILKAWCREHRQHGRFIGLPDLLRRTRDGIHGPERSDADIPEETTPILILDDLSAAKMTDWASELVYMLVNRRYNAMRPTIYTSNLPLDGIAVRLGDQVASRIAGSCRIVEVSGDDRRLTR